MALSGRPALTQSATPTSVAMLPGFGAVPPKLIKKIVSCEYVDIWELLPETWQVENEGSCCHSKRPRRSLVTDINVWTECYATMAAILSAAFPQKAPHFSCIPANNHPRRVAHSRAQLGPHTTWPIVDMQPTTDHWTGLRSMQSYTMRPLQGGHDPCPDVNIVWLTHTYHRSVYILL